MRILTKYLSSRYVGEGKGIPGFRDLFLCVPGIRDLPFVYSGNPGLRIPPVSRLCLFFFRESGIDEFFFTGNPGFGLKEEIV